MKITNKNIFISLSIVIISSYLIYKYAIKNDKTKNKPPLNNKEIRTKKENINWDVWVEYKVKPTINSLIVYEMPNFKSKQISKLERNTKFQGQPLKDNDGWVVVLNQDTTPMSVLGYVTSFFVS
jgi:hypothetical protein